MHNYPEGAASDPRAPWNQKDDEDESDESCSCDWRRDRYCPKHGDLNADMERDRRIDDRLTRGG